MLVASGFTLLLLIIGTWCICKMAWNGSTQLIFPPRRLPAATPADYGLEFESAAFESQDGTALRGGFIPAPDSTRAIMLCHGYSVDCSPDLVYAPLLRAAGYALLLFDFRGHGTSDGGYTSLVYFDCGDVLAALDYLRSRGITRVGLLGFSMGGAIVLTN